MFLLTCVSVVTVAVVRRGSQDRAAAQPRGEGPPLLRRPRWCIRPWRLPHVRPPPPSPHAATILIPVNSGSATVDSLKKLRGVAYLCLAPNADG